MTSERENRICRCLRTKMQYVAGISPEELRQPSATAQYWCVHTMSQVGPDDGLVAPEGCRAGRDCFEERE